MIVGIGVDLTDIRRIEKLTTRYGTRFLTRIYTPRELSVAENHVHHDCWRAKRFAAKEACLKALGTGLAQGVFWRNICIETDKQGRPEIHLSGGAQKRLNAITPHAMQAKIALTISDEYPYAMAFVIICAAPVA